MPFTIKPFFWIICVKTLKSCTLPDLLMQFLEATLRLYWSDRDEILHRQEQLPWSRICRAWSKLWKAMKNKGNMNACVLASVNANWRKLLYRLALFRQTIEVIKISRSFWDLGNFLVVALWLIVAWFIDLTEILFARFSLYIWGPCERAPQKRGNVHYRIYKSSFHS